MSKKRGDESKRVPGGERVHLDYQQLELNNFPTVPFLLERPANYGMEREHLKYDSKSKVFQSDLFYSLVQENWLS